MEARETHARLQREMREAWLNYKIEEDDIEIPQPDLTFLEETDDLSQSADMEAIGPEFLESSKKSYCHVIRMGKVAVVLLAVLVTISTAAMFLDSDASYGGGGTIQNIKRFFSPKQGPVAENGDRSGKEAQVEDPDQQDLIVTDWEDVKKHKDLMARLFLPQYIPEGYAFDRVWFANTEDVTAAVYTYRKGETKLMISVENLKEEGAASLEGDSYVEPKTGREFQIAKDKKEGTQTISVMEEDDVFRVCGVLDKEEGIKIIDSLKVIN